MSILDTLGISEEELNKATGSTVTEAFELMPSGVYPAKIKEVILYKNKFGGEMLKINVAIKHNDQDRIVSFRDDIGKNLKQTLSSNIKSIEFSHREMCKCVTVDREDGMFLIGDFIPTHNSKSYSMASILNHNFILGENSTACREITSIATAY